MRMGVADIALNAIFAKCPLGSTFGTNQATQFVRACNDLCNPSPNPTNYPKTQIKGVNMTNLEIKQKLEQAQSLLSDIYHWADMPMSNGLQTAPEKTNSEIASLMSCADGCIYEALDALQEIA